MYVYVPGFVGDTMNSVLAITASVGVPIATHASATIPHDAGGQDPSPTTRVPPYPDQANLRSEDSATGKTEGGNIELRSVALRLTPPRTEAPTRGQRDATQAIDDLRQLEENVWKIH